MKYYLVGIKGTGMSSLACILKDMGNVVTGSDVKEHFFTEKSLDEKNITYEEFTDEVTNEYFYIISSAYDINNIVVKKIINENYNYMYYHEFIEFFFKKKKIGICGSHGKTTTTTTITNGTTDAGVFTTVVKNSKGFTLPTTGGIGTFVFTFAGIAMMAAAVILLITGKKKKAE